MDADGDADERTDPDRNHEGAAGKEKAPHLFVQSGSGGGEEVSK
jgi:hypothetical protein